MAQKSKEVDDYLQATPAGHQVALGKLREIILEAVPDAVECISYQIPAFRSNGKVAAGFSSAAKHCALYLFSGSIVEQFRGELGGFSISKGTVRFTPENPLPDDLVRRLLATRLEEIGSSNS